jgi:hypothetical protein
MLNTAKNTIKKAAKYQVEFFLLLLTGMLAGSIFTLAYVKFWGKGDVTFADIGGMLAGAGTIGLLVVAIKTANAWKRQSIQQTKIDSLNDLSSKSLEFITGITIIYQDIFDSAGNCFHGRRHLKVTPKDTSEQQLNYFIAQSSNIQLHIIKIEAVWNIKVHEDFHQDPNRIIRFQNSIRTATTDFTMEKANKEIKFFEEKDIVLKHELSKLYKQLHH